jgi:hypothetical protein
MIEQSEWIRRDIDISSFYDKLSKIVKTLIAEAEEAEKIGKTLLSTKFVII